MGMQIKEILGRHKFIKDHPSKDWREIMKDFKKKYGNSPGEYRMHQLVLARDRGIAIDQLLFPQVAAKIKEEDRKLAKKIHNDSMSPKGATKKLSNPAGQKEFSAPKVENNQYIVSKELLKAVDQLKEIASKEGFKDFAFVVTPDGKSHLIGQKQVTLLFDMPK